MRRSGYLAALALGSVLLAAVAGAGEEGGVIVFSLRQWQGTYTTSDQPGGVAISQFSSALYCVPADGSAPPRRLIAVAGRADAPRCSPDGRWLYFQAPGTGGGHLFRCRPDGTGVQDLTGPPWPPGDRYGLGLSRDGTRIAYTEHDGQIGRVGVMNADGTDAHLIAPDIGYHYMAALSPDNRSVVFAHTARGYVLALKHLDTGELLTLTPGLPESFCPQFTPAGKTIVFFRRDGDYYRVDAEGSHLQRLTEGCQHAEFRLSARDEHGSSDPPALSPDGQRIAYLAKVTGVEQVHVMNLDGSGQRQITYRPTPCGRVSFSPDGTRLAFVSWQGEYCQLFVIPAAGGEPRQLTDLPGAVFAADWRGGTTGEARDRTEEQVGGQ